jgi:hypothetical protein
MANILTSRQVAVLIVHLVLAYDKEKGKTTTRFRISGRTLRALSSRVHLRESLINEVIDEMSAWGWAMFPVGDHFALIRVEVVDGWPRIASKRIREVLRRAHEGDESVFNEIELSLERLRELPEDEDGSTNGKDSDANIRPSRRSS